MLTLARKYIALGFSVVPGLSIILRVIIIYTSFLLAYGQFHLDGNVVFATAALYFYVLFLVMMNNYLDREADRLTHPERALPSGKVSVGEARAFLAVTAAVALGFGALVENKAFVVLLAAAGLVYSVVTQSKYTRFQIPFLVIVYNAVNVAIVVLLAGVAASRITLALELFAAALFVFYLANLNYCSIRDLEGDRRCGVQTIAVVGGARAAAWVAQSLAVAGIALSLWLSYQIRMFGQAWVIPVLVVPVGLVALAHGARFLRTNSPDFVLRTQSWFDHLERGLFGGVWLAVVANLVAARLSSLG